MKEYFKLIRNILTIRPVRKFIARRIKNLKYDFKYRNLRKFTKKDIVRENSVLIVEPHFGHGECLPGYTKYFQDLGYNVDIITRYENVIEDPFCKFKNKPRIFSGSLPIIRKFLLNNKSHKYEYIFIETSVIWDFETHKHFCDYLKFTPYSKKGCLFIDHDPGRFFKEFSEQTLVKQNRIFTLSDIPEMPQLNPCYFYDTKNVFKKNNKTIFLAIGRISKDSRNYSDMVKATSKLISEGKDFVIKIIGNGKIDIPENLKKYIIHLGRLSFKKMYKEIEKSDFIITALDPYSEEHKIYLTTCTSGNLQLSYGFKKPLIINDMFAKHYGLSESNSVLYSENNIFDAMKKAINMKLNKYISICKGLKKETDKVYKKSLDNLKIAINSDHKTGLKTNMVIMCKTYLKNLEAIKILKNSIDKHNIDKIPFYILCPSSEIETIKSNLIDGKEDYKIEFIEEEKILGSDSLGNGWLDQQIIKLKFYKTKIADFYLIIDSDSYFIKDFYVSDFMYDDKTPYIVCHEGKAGTILNSKFGDTEGMYRKEQFIKRYFNRKGKDYRGLTTPIMFSSYVCEKLDKDIGAKFAIKLCSCEASWHLEYLLKLNVPFKATELFFEAIVYPKKLYLWHKLKIKMKDISKQYLGIVMQDKFLKQRKY